MAERSALTKVFEAEGESSNARDFLPEAEYMPQSASRVLDIGCGGGDLACFLASGAGQVVALDVSLEVLRAVQAKQTERELSGLHLVVADVNRLPFRDNCFDYVVSRYTLHHTELDRSLPEVRRVVARGGRLMLRDIFAPLPSLERWTAWQLFKILIKTALHVRGRGPRSAWRFFRFNVSRESLDHMLYQNRLVDGQAYRSTHRRWFPGCGFQRLRPRLLFWEAPALRWEKPAAPAPTPEP